MINIDHIRTQIINAIKQSGMSYTALAEKIGVKHQTVSQYIHNNILPSLDTLANLCAVLDLDSNEILCISEYKTNENK